MKLPKKRTRIEPAQKKKVNRKQAPGDPRMGVSQSGSEAAPKVRFEATIHAGRKASAERLNQLNIDRVPSPPGQVRALVTADECVRLLDQGFEIRLQHAHPVRPLDPALIETDESVHRWLDKRLGDLVRRTAPNQQKRGKHT